MMEGGEVLVRGWWSTIANGEQEWKISLWVLSPENKPHRFGILTGQDETNLRGIHCVSSSLSKDVKEEDQLTLLKRAPKSFTLHWEQAGPFSQWTTRNISSKLTCVSVGRSSEVLVQVHVSRSRQNHSAPPKINYSYTWGFLWVWGEQSGLWWLSSKLWHSVLWDKSCGSRRETGKRNKG